MEIKILNKSENPIPAYETEGSAGMDLRASLSEEYIDLEPMERYIIPTGLYMEIPKGWEGQIRPRSGLSIKKGLTVINAPGTIDSDYRGEVGIPIINLSKSRQTISNGERIAQIVFAEHSRANLVKIFSLSELTDTERGGGGFGHTGSE